MAELKPCPFCGKTNIFVCKEDGEYQVVCDFSQEGCGASSGFRESMKKAVEVWNRRVDISALTAADVQPVIETENMATVSDEFICKKCGIHLEDYSKVVMDEDSDGYIDELHYEYEPKFCPECGAKIVEED